jgi:hypothetical protein
MNLIPSGVLLEWLMRFVDETEFVNDFESLKDLDFIAARLVRRQIAQCTRIITFWPGFVSRPELRSISVPGRRLSADL